MRLVLPPLCILALVSCSEGTDSTDSFEVQATGKELAVCLAAQQSDSGKPTSAQARQMMSNCGSELKAHSIRLVEAQFRRSFDPEDNEMKEALSVHSEALMDYLGGQIEQGTAIKYD